MKIKYKNKGVCSTHTLLEIDDETKAILNCEIIGGCMGNLAGISSLLRGMDANDAIDRLKGINCGFRKTSCPDQVSMALEEALKDIDKLKAI